MYKKLALKIVLPLYFVGIFSGLTSAQNLLNSDLSGFENSEGHWESDSSGLITVTSEQAASGANSFKYSLTQSFDEKSVFSIDTKHTIMHVRTASNKDGKFIVAATYEGAILGVSYSGVLLWKNELSGFMVHDLWCADLDDDGYEEVLVANADGAAYCLSNDGKQKWKFQPDETPMYAITVVHKNSTPYVVCGGFDLSIYYLGANGNKLKQIKSSTYSVESTWGIDSKYNKLHFSNFLRPLKKSSGEEVLALQGNNNHMQLSGSLYLFDVLADKPYKITELPNSRGLGDVNICDVDKDGNEELLFGNSQHYSSTAFMHVHASKNEIKEYPVQTKNFGYLITHPALIKDGGIDKFFALHGNQLHLVPVNENEASVEYLVTKYAFNGIWQDKTENLLFLASSQSGGSCIHILNLNNQDWKEDFVKIEAHGKLKKIIENTDFVRNKIKSYSKPDYVRETLPVYFIEGNYKSGIAKMVSEDIKANYNSPKFLRGTNWIYAEDWDRSSIEKVKYRDRRDGRRTYTKTQQECVDFFSSLYPGEDGIGVWGGHGNDPYYFQLSTHKKIMDAAGGKKTILIFPELEDHSSDFAWVMEDLFYPMAEYAQTRNTQIYVRTKHNFWYGNAYLPMWKKMLDGKYPDVFVPSMEETTDKSMDISIPARAGIWASGAVNTWGSRSVPDNPAFDRARQFGYQRITNHFLRHSVYMMANGATVINNFASNPDYMSVLWELIAKGALFIPKSNEILSYSPVHLSMQNPDHEFMSRANNAKWNVFYNKDFEDNNPFVFGRQDGTWIGAQVNEWDYSRYASGVTDRRHNFMPPTPNGMVLITPPQAGAFASNESERGALTDHLHPIYKNIMKEYYTDGRYYYSADGTQKYNADTYYTTIENDIKQLASQLPLTVEGEAAWVLAQLDETHLRLTLVDRIYLSPGERKVKLSFHSVTPVKMVDILDGTSFNVSNKSNVEVDIPCGLFRFIDIELNAPLNQN